MLAKPYDLSAAHDVDIRPNASHLRVVPYPSSIADEHIVSFVSCKACVGAMLLSFQDRMIQDDSNSAVNLHWGFGKCELADFAGASAGTTLSSFSTRSPFSVIIPKVPVEALMVDFLVIWWRLTSYDKEELRKKAPPVVFGDPGHPFISCSSAVEHEAFNLSMLTPGARLPVVLNPGTALVLDNRRMLIGFPCGLAADNVDVFNSEGMRLSPFATASSSVESRRTPAA
jgi:hypothetical protein